MVRFNDFYGIKNNKFFYFGSGTTPQGSVDANWLAKAEFGNRFINHAGPVAAYAKVPGAFPGTTALFNPLPESDADYLNNANWTASNAAISLDDPFFNKVKNDSEMVLLNADNCGKSDYRNIAGKVLHHIAIDCLSAQFRPEECFT